MLWFESGVLPNWSCLEACTQLMVLCGKAVEPLGDGDLLEKVVHWAWALKLNSPPPASCSFFAAPVQCDQLPPPHAFSTMMVCVTSNCEPKVNLSFLSCFCQCVLLQQGEMKLIHSPSLKTFLSLHLSPASEPSLNQSLGCSLW